MATDLLHVDCLGISGKTAIQNSIVTPNQRLDGALSSILTEGGKCMFPFALARFFFLRCLLDGRMGDTVVLSCLCKCFSFHTPRVIWHRSLPVSSSRLSRITRSIEKNKGNIVFPSFHRCLTGKNVTISRQDRSRESELASSEPMYSCTGSSRTDIHAAYERLKKIHGRLKRKVEQIGKWMECWWAERWNGRSAIVPGGKHVTCP